MQTTVQVLVADCHIRVSEGCKHSENSVFWDSLNFDAPHRANARTHAQAETANRLLSLCSIGSSKENKKKLKLKNRFAGEVE